MTEAAFRDALCSHILELQVRDIDQVLEVLATHCPAAYTCDLNGHAEVDETHIDEAGWAALWAHARDPSTARACARCGLRMPHLWAALQHQRTQGGGGCGAPAPRRCAFPCRFVEGEGEDLDITLEEHMRDCRWAAVPCAWCGQAFPRHCDHAAVCSRRPVQCDGCGEEFPVEDMKAHTAACPALRVACSHQGCSARVPRGELAAHLFRCDFRQTCCPWCRAPVLGRDLAAHQRACPRRRVECNECGAVVEWGEKGSGLRRHALEHHQIPRHAARLRCADKCAAAGKGPCSDLCARDAKQLLHARYHRFQCGATRCTTCRRLRLVAAFHEKQRGEPCTEDCGHPLCGRRTVRCSWPGCGHAGALDDIVEHERHCPHRIVTCPVCAQGPFDLESMRHHLQPPHGCARVAAIDALDKNQKEKEAHHAMHCAVGGPPACARCRVWEAVLAFNRDKPFAGRSPG